MLNVVFSLINSLPLRIAFGLYKMWQRNVGKQGRRDKKIRKKRRNREVEKQRRGRVKQQRTGKAKKQKSTK